MTHVGQPVEFAVQKKLARRYRVLGYDVDENPGADRLPDFMHGAEPDMIARGRADNVVIEIKTHASLKGSNDIVGIAERVSHHPDWRFELVVLEDEEESESADADDRRLSEMVRSATEHQLFDMAFVFVANVLVQTMRRFARRTGVRANGKSDSALLADLGFRGLLPGSLVERYRLAVARRDQLAHAPERAAGVSEAEVKQLLDMWQDMRALL